MPNKLTNEIDETNERINEITKLIDSLENSYPKDARSREWHIHHTNVRDAYWQRRTIVAEKDGLNLSDTATVY